MHYPPLIADTSFADLLHIFEKETGWPSETNRYIFNGKWFRDLVRFRGRGRVTGRGRGRSV